MIKLMIVDDERVIRRGLYSSINWEENGIFITGEAKNGFEAYEKSVIHHPDIIISDIRMNDGDGFWLIEKINETQPWIRKILLSGYSDKEYMLKAIKLGVNEYLLKPAGAKQILQAVLKQRDEILLAQREKQQTIRLENEITENLDILKSYFLEELLDHALSVEYIQQKIQSLKIALQGPKYALFVIKSQEESEFEVVQAIASFFEAYSPVLVSLKDKTIITILNAAENIQNGEIMPLVNRILPLVDPMYRPCYGEACDIEKLYLLYKSCKGMILRSIWFDDPLLHAYTEICFGDFPREELMRYEHRIIQTIHANNIIAMTEELDAMFGFFAGAKPSNELFRNAVLTVAHSIQMFGNVNNFYDKIENRLDKKYSPGDIKEVFLSILNNDYSQYGIQIKNILNFISNNCDHDLMLADVAAAVYISPSYLTRLLKTRTGNSFNEWLHIIRIARAKELLEDSNLLHYEIAEKVGYSSYKIFSEYFSKITGCSARNYRQNICGKGSKKIPPSAANESPENR
jgi:two-component system response regulator YesN